MVVDGGWWWLMVVDGGWWWLMVVNNEHSFYFVYLWPKSIWKAGGPKSQPGTLANSRDHDVGNLAQVHNWTTPTKHGHGPGSEVLTPQKKTPIVEGKTRHKTRAISCWVLQLAGFGCRDGWSHFSSTKIAIYWVYYDILRYSSILLVFRYTQI